MSALSRVLRSVEGGRVMFRCPGCDENHVITVDPPAGYSGPRWTWNRDAERPTFSPSILVTVRDPDGEIPDETCHSFVTDGRIQFLGDCTHALAGQTVDLPAAWEPES